MPIPYPVILSFSSNLAKGTKTVKVDGRKMAAVKGSEFSRCVGDEPGTAGGVVSQTNMKEAKWILYSFDVKMDGKNACRLADKMTMNHGNTVCLQGEMQGPVVGIDMSKVGKKRRDACKKIKDGKVPDGGHDEAAQAAGMLKEDYDAIRQVARQDNAILTFRDSNPACMPHLKAGVPSKGLVKEKTWPADCLPHDRQDMAGLVSNKDKMTGFDPNPGLHPSGKLTGDYDMHDMLDGRSGKRIQGESPRDFRLRDRMNAAIPGDQPRIMHGAQANYADFLRNDPKAKPVPYLMQPDPPITVFDGSKKPAAVYRLETNEDILNFYKCKGTDVPPEWNLQDASTGAPVKL